MKESDRQLLEGFLNYPLLHWIDSMPLPMFIQLAKQLLSTKLVTWAMLRTITNALDCTQDFRELLTPDQQQDFLAVEASLRKPPIEELIWTYAVCYLFLRNCVELIHRQEALIHRVSALDELKNWEFKQLQQRMEGDIFRNTMKALHGNKKIAYPCYTKIGSQTLALALHGIPAPACLQLLDGAVSANFIKDTLQLRDGAFLHFSAFNVLSARDILINAWVASQSSEQPQLPVVLGQTLTLEKRQRHRCLYQANLIDLGYALQAETKPAPLMAKLKEALHPIYYMLLQAAREGKLKINRTDPEAVRKLEMENLRCSLQNASGSDAPVGAPA